MTQEKCWILVGEVRGGLWFARRKQCVRGEPASVEFDAQWVLRREEEQGDVVGFFHTHPSGSTDPSGRDLRTMRAWCSCCGKPLLCCIESDRDLAAYRFDDETSAGIKLPVCERFGRDIVVAVDAPMP